MTARLRRLISVPALALAAVVALPACYSDVKVVQGTVTSSDPAAAMLDVKDERAPNATATYRLKEPATVAPGDLVRVAFRDGSDGKTVIRLMNLTRHRAKNKTDRK